MIHYLLLPVAAVLGAIGRRTAGGLLNEIFRPSGGRVFGDTPARLIFGATVAASALLGGIPVGIAAALLPAVWAGTTIGNFAAIDLARNEGTFARDWFALQLHGAAGVALPVLIVWWFGLSWIPLVVAGLAISPAYWLGWSIAGRRIRAGYPVGLRQATEIGEALWGASVAVGAFLA